MSCAHGVLLIVRIVVEDVVEHVAAPTGASSIAAVTSMCCRAGVARHHHVHLGA